jgi:signal peptidase I
MSRVLRTAGKALTVLLCLGSAALVWPTSLGGATSYVKVSGTSMVPKLRNGDLVMTRSVGRYQIGDVVAYRVPKGEVGADLLVLHRIVGGSATRGFVTRGDNRDFNDPWKPKAADIIGEKWVVVSGAGNAMGRLRSPLALAVFASLLAAAAAFTMLRRRPPTNRAESGALVIEPESEIILVVDDESSFRRSIARMLTDSGYQVCEAEDGRSALDAVANGLHPALVLSDVVMPDISGPELSIQLSEEGIRNTVLMSGRDIEADPRRFLRKPFQEQELLDLVRRELDERASTRT